MIGPLGFFRSGTGEIGGKTLSVSLIILVGCCEDGSLGGCESFCEGSCAGGSVGGFEGGGS